MLNTGRRSATSTSELGLYSDREERYHTSRYGIFTRKCAIGVMVVVSVILVAIFLYDFTSVTSTHSKGSQETKHIYILQNALRRSSGLKKSVNSTGYDNSRNDFVPIQDRSDDVSLIEPEGKAQNLDNFKMRKRIVKLMGNNDEDEVPETKESFDNHALIYRVRQRYKQEEESSSEDNPPPTPFHWEYKTPHPTLFKRSRYPQLSQYRYPHSSRNIQDIIKYLTGDDGSTRKGIKFTGVYLNPKKYDLPDDLGEIMANSDKYEEEEEHHFGFNGDPFYQYKPKHPADVNLLAPSNVRFSPTGVQRYNPNQEIYYSRPHIKQPDYYDNVGSYATSNYGRKRKPKPFSVMLDIYPITDLNESNKKTSGQDLDFRRPVQYSRNPKHYGNSIALPIVALPNQQSLTDEEEKQQMIFHLNLYPRKKNKFTRNELLQRSAAQSSDDREEFANKIVSPLNTIAKHLADHTAAIRGSSDFDSSEDSNNAKSKYDSSDLPYENEFVPTNHQSNNIDSQSTTTTTASSITLDSNYYLSKNVEV